MAIRSSRLGFNSSANLPISSTARLPKNNKSFIVASQVLPASQRPTPSTNLPSRSQVTVLTPQQPKTIQPAAIRAMPFVTLPKLKEAKENEIPARKEKSVTKTSFLNKITQPRTLGLIGTAVAAKAVFAYLAVKLGPLAATHLLAQHTIAFLTPGVYTLGFALEIALKVTSTVLVHGVLPIALPIISSVVVTGLAFALAVYIGYRLIDAAKDQLYVVWKSIEAELDKHWVTWGIKKSLVSIYSILFNSPEAKNFVTSTHIASSTSKNRMSYLAKPSLFQSSKNFQSCSKKALGSLNGLQPDFLTMRHNALKAQKNSPSDIS